MDKKPLPIACETGPIQFELLPNGMHARLIREHRVVINNRRIVVPPGFVTDFASVPRVFWRIIPPWGEYSPAAVVHDYLYQLGPVTRREADEIFRLIMEWLGVPWAKRWCMYYAVRVGGWLAWRHYRAAEAGSERAPAEGGS